MKKKQCTKCVQVKSVSEFSKNKNNKDGLHYWCKLCMSKAHKNWKKTPKAKESTKRSRMKFNYNLTLEQHKEKYIEQNGCCGICREAVPYSIIFTDHNHETNKVRKLLCNRCNAMLGYVEKYPELPKLMMKYLEHFKEEK